MNGNSNNNKIQLNWVSDSSKVIGIIAIINMVLFFTFIFGAQFENFLGFSNISSTLLMLAFYCFISMFVLAFVIVPFSEFISPTKNIKTLIIIYIQYMVLGIFILLFNKDTFALYVGASFVSIFIIGIPLSIITDIKKKKTNIEVIKDLGNKSPQTINNDIQNHVILNCTKCGSVIKVEDKFCETCGAKIEGDNIKVSEVSTIKQEITNENMAHIMDYDPIYKLPENKLIDEFIKKRLDELKINKSNKLMPKVELTKKKILSIIFGILLFTYVSLIFFHFPIYTYIIGFVILIVDFVMLNKYNFIKYLKKKLIQRPSEKIDNIILNEQKNLLKDNTKLFFGIGVVVAVLLPLLIFKDPRIFYEKQSNGYAVRFYTFGLTNYKTAVIPEKYKNENVVSLRGNTFSNMPFLKSVNLPDSVTEIRGQAFKNCYKLTEINMPRNLEYLGGGVFYNAKSIKSIALPDTLTYLGGESFYNAKSLEYIKLSNNLTEIRGDSFEYCTSLKSIIIPDNITRIGGHAFYGASSLSEVSISENSKLNEIGSSAFRQCSSLYNITIPSNTSVNERAFKESPTTVTRYENLSNASSFGDEDTISDEGKIFNFKEYNNLSIRIIKVDESKVISGYNASKGTALIEYNGVSYLFNYDNTDLSGSAQNHFIVDDLYILFDVTHHVNSGYREYQNLDVQVRSTKLVPNDAYYNSNYKDHISYRLNLSNPQYFIDSDYGKVEITLENISIDNQTKIKTYNLMIDDKLYQINNTDRPEIRLNNYSIQIIGLYENFMDIEVHYNG